jgi:hypothetical protein
MKDWTNEEFDRALEEVTRRSIFDVNFRTLALQDASAAISQVAGKPLPGGVDLKFIDNTGPTKIVPLPDPIAHLSCEEVTDEELEHVAGGDAVPVDGTVGGGIKWSR